MDFYIVVLSLSLSRCVDHDRPNDRLSYALCNLIVKLSGGVNNERGKIIGVRGGKSRRGSRA